MRIRTEAPDDHEAISAVVVAAFLRAEHSGGNEAQIVERLRSERALILSLVAVENERIVGHVAFSPVTIDGRDEGWSGLAPVSVVPQRQRQGTGSALIKAGLAILRNRRAKGCVVLGDPAFYRRFGFAVDPKLVLPAAPAEYFQCLAFDHPAPSGLVSYHPAFALG